MHREGRFEGESQVLLQLLRLFVSLRYRNVLYAGRVTNLLASLETTRTIHSNRGLAGGEGGHVEERRHAARTS